VNGWSLCWVLFCCSLVWLNQSSLRKVLLYSVHRSCDLLRESHSGRLHRWSRFALTPFTRCNSRLHKPLLIQASFSSFFLTLIFSVSSYQCHKLKLRICTIVLCMPDFCWFDGWFKRQMNCTCMCNCHGPSVNIVDPTIAPFKHYIQLYFTNLVVTDRK